MPSISSHDMNNYFVMITSGEQSIVFFERILNKSSWVRFIRMNLQGQIESSGYMEHPNIKGYSMHSENNTPVYTTGFVTLWSYAGSRQKLDNTKADRLELQRHTVEHSIRTRLSKKEFLWWKDVAYLGNYTTPIGLENSKFSISRLRSVRPLR